MPDVGSAGEKSRIRLRIDQTVELGSGAGLVRVSPLEQAYLLLLQQAGNRGMSRQEAFRLLWATGDSGSARHRLRQLNYNLKRKAGDPVVETDGSLVRLSDAVTVEWGRTPGWEGFPTPTDAYADRIEEMRRARERSAAREVVQELESARLSDAPEALLGYLARGETAPTAWRDALWALLRTGRVREAEFELRRAFGAKVPPEGLSLGRRLARHATKLLNTAAAGGEVSIPLIGRTSETQRLTMLLVQETPSILLTGGHGVGRSRLLGHAVATVLTDGEDLVVLSARGNPNETERPFGGLTQLLSEETLPQAHDELGQPHHEVLSRALPVRFESRGPHHLAQIGGPGSYLRVAQALEALFARAFGTAGVVLCIDDLHLIDRSTLEVITFLLREGTTRLLGTWCTEEPGSDTELVLRVHSLRAELVPLGDLDLESAARFAGAMNPEIPTDEAAEIARVAGGRPGRIADLIRALGGAGLPRGHGPSLDRLLRERVRELPAGEQEVLLLLAVNRGRLAVEALAGVLEVGILEAAGLTRSLEESGLVRIDADDTAVVPGLLRDFILREMPSSVREANHRRIADVLEDSGSDDYATIGHHRLAAGRPAEAAEWFQKAAASAKDQTAYAEAIALLEKSIASADEYDPDLGGDLGRLYFGMGDFQNSIHAYERARGEFAKRGHTVQEVQNSILLRLTHLEAGHSPADLFPQFRSHFARAQTIGEPHLIAQALDAWLKAANYCHNRTELLAARGALLAEVNASRSATDFAEVGARLVHLGYPRLGMDAIRRGYLAVRRQPSLRLRYLSRLILAAWATGYAPQRTRSLVRLAEAFAEDSGNLEDRLNLRSNLGLWHLDSGRYADAARCLDSAIRMLPSPENVQARVLETNHAILAIRTGNLEAAQRWSARLAERQPSARQSLNLIRDAVSIFVALEAGRLKDAISLGERLQEVDLSFPFDSNLAVIPEALAELRRRLGEKAEGQRLLKEAAEQMGHYNVPCKRQLLQRLRSRIWRESYP